MLTAEIKARMALTKGNKKFTAENTIAINTIMTKQAKEETIPC